MNNQTSMTVGMYDREGDEYPEFSSLIKTNFEKAIQDGSPLFTTNVFGLFNLFLERLPDEARQHYNCNACRSFVTHYGGLVTITPSGNIQSAMWSRGVPKFFAEAVEAMRVLVINAKVTGVFIPSQEVLGIPVTGVWHHMHVEVPKDRVHNSKLTYAHQVVAEKKEDFRILNEYLADYPLSIVLPAVKLLKTDSLYRSEKCLGVAEWLQQLQSAILAKSSKQRRNLVWLAVATAPPGFCHIKESMIGTLLDDLKAGLDFNDISRRFAEKMHPLKYQRPQAAPTSGNVARAEEIVKKLGIEKSLERRFARLDEIQTLWIPKQVKQQYKEGHSVFSHLVTKDKAPEPQDIKIPIVTMTWDKFLRTVLPEAETIEFYAISRRDNYSAILTAAHEDAPPIIQWDKEERRNPFSGYMYHSGSYPSHWNVTPGYNKVTAITYHPALWHENVTNHAKSVIFILDGAKDTEFKDAGNALFPEMLKPELREIRSTIESYSRKATIQGYDESSACGISLQEGVRWDYVFRVKTSLGVANYKLDRWD